MIRNFFSAMMLILASSSFIAQETEKANVEHNENKDLPLKLHHAEPLYNDLMRDLGARKGEREWNVAMSVAKKGNYYELSPLVEYEWAVANRLGLEVELPFTIYSSAEKQSYKSAGSKLDGIKLAMQYTFLVDKKSYTSMAIGYINELELNSFRDYGKRLITGNMYNPFLVIAKGWGKSHNISTMIYTGPQFTHHFEHNNVDTDWQINTSIHYLVPNTKNFIGLEINKSINKERFNLVLRPQMRVALQDNLILGLVVGVPTNTEYEGFSGFARLIYEPKKHK